MTPFDEVMSKCAECSGSVCQCNLYDFIHSMVHISSEDISDPSD